jgi:hypothetical protein
MAKMGFGPLGLVVLSVAFSSLMAAGCAPKDEKISNRYTGGSGSGTTDERFGDHVTEYSRSMLIELADVARQAESVLQVVASRDQAPPEVSGPVAPAALRTSSCKTITSVPSPDGSLKFATDIKACKEKGFSFSGTQYGREVAYASFSKTAGAPTLATLIKVEGKGIETTLVPNANIKDTLRVKSQRFLDAQFVSEENGQRLYRFTFENYSSYSLDLKALTDQGAITSTVSGVLVYDLAENRVTAFRALSDPDRLNLKVESARQGRSGGRVVRQEFYGSGVANGDLAIDLSNCALPVGLVKSRFTVRPLSGDKKYIVDSSTVVQSLKDVVFDTLKPTAGQAVAKVCSPDEQITMTEFYAGLLY